jgi:hypothetical protein
MSRGMKLAKRRPDVNNLGTLRSAGLLDNFSLTREGREAARPAQAMTPDESLALLLQPLSPAQRRIVEILVEAGRGVGREELAGALGAHARTKSFMNNIGALRSRKLVTSGWPIAASDVLRRRG